MKVAKVIGPLEGIKVLDFGQAAIGPVCGRLLAEAGADVIKVEPLEGDFARITPDPGVDSITFIVNNIGKRSLSVNLKHPKGMQIVLDLASKSDVIIQNFRPGVMKKLGLDYGTLSATNPKLVFASLYMYGETGPVAHRRGGDIWAQAFTGFVASQGNPEGPPQMVGHTVIDYCGAVVGAFAIMLALYGRQQTGRGQEVSTNLLNVGTFLQWPAIAHYLAEGLLYKKVGRGAVRTRFPYGAYTAKDGDVVTFFGQDDDEWTIVCSILGIEYLLTDPRYDTAAKRNKRKSDLYPILDEAFSKRTRAEWAELFRQEKLRCDPCLDYAELTSHPQFQVNKTAIKINDPRDGEMVFPDTPVRLGQFPPPDYVEHAPILGEHTTQILQELGYTEQQVVELGEEGAVGLPTSDMFTVKRKVKGSLYTPSKGAAQRKTK